MIAPRSRQLLSLLVLLLPACGGGGGTVSSPSQLLTEIEVNDNATYADYIGELVPGDFVLIDQFFPAPNTNGD